MRDVALLASMRNIDHEIVESALLSLRGIVASCLPDYTVVPFGSYAMGVMLHGGAVDVTLIRHDTYQTSPSPDEPQHALTQGHVSPFTPVAPLQALCDALHVAAGQSSDIRYVRTAMHEYLACSLKAFELSPAPIKFHITVESSAAVQLACFVRNYIEDHPSVLPLLVFLRAVLFGEMQLPKEQINPTVLTLSVVAFFQHLIGASGNLNVAPGGSLISFLNYFSAGGIFDPKRVAISPLSPHGFVAREPTLFETWMVHCPHTPSPFNSAASCFHIFFLRQRLLEILHLIHRNYFPRDVYGISRDAEPSAVHAHHRVYPATRLHLVALLMPHLHTSLHARGSSQRQQSLSGWTPK
jgi:hypothetical protein